MRIGAAKPRILQYPTASNSDSDDDDSTLLLLLLLLWPEKSTVMVLSACVTKGHAEDELADTEEAVVLAMAVKL